MSAAVANSISVNVMDNYDLDFQEIEHYLRYSIDHSDASIESVDPNLFAGSLKGRQDNFELSQIDLSSWSSPCTSVWGTPHDRMLDLTSKALVAHHIDRSGQSLLLSQHFTDNHRVIRPDDSVHINLISSTSFLLLLSNEDSQAFGRTRWLGQFNGRGNFLATLAEDEHIAEMPTYVMSVSAQSVYMDLRTDMGIPVLCLAGQLAVRVLADQPMHLIFSFPGGTPVMSAFNIQLALTPQTLQLTIDTATLNMSKTMTADVRLEDSHDPMTFTTRYPVRSRGKARKNNSRSTICRARP